MGVPKGHHWDATMKKQDSEKIGLPVVLQVRTISNFQTWKGKKHSFIGPKQVSVPH